MNKRVSISRISLDKLRRLAINPSKFSSYIPTSDPKRYLIEVDDEVYKKLCLAGRTPDQVIAELPESRVHK